MRIFNEFEKTIITRMIALDEKSGSLNVLGNIISGAFGEISIPDYCYVQFGQKNRICLKIRKDVFDEQSSNVEWLRDIDKSISKTLVAIVTLFDFLERKHLAFFTGNNELESLGVVFANVQYIKADFIDHEIGELIKKFATKRIYVSEDLKNLAQNQFRTTDDIRDDRDHRRNRVQLWITFGALVVTTVSLVWSVFSVSFTPSNVKIVNQGLPAKVQPLEYTSIEKTISKQVAVIINATQLIAKEMEKTKADSVNGAKVVVEEASLEKISMSLDKIHSILKGFKSLESNGKKVSSSGKTIPSLVSHIEE